MPGLSIILAVLLSAAWGAVPCGARLDSLSRDSAEPGETLELRGSWGPARGAMVPQIGRGEPGRLDVLAWAPSSILVRVPRGLPPGKYKVGVHCDPGVDSPHTTDWLDFTVLEGAPASPQTPGRPPGAAPGSGVSLESWLEENPRLRDALLWPEAGGSSSYDRWPRSRRAALEKMFQGFSRGEPSGLPDPPKNIFLAGDEDPVRQVLSPEDAEALYLAYAAHALALEAGGGVPWSILEYSDDELSVLLNGTVLFRPEGAGYRLRERTAGRALPAPPDAAFAFMKPRLGRTDRDTVVALLEWVRSNAVHYTGRFTGRNVEDQWQYRGFPPVSRILAGTEFTGNPRSRPRSRSAGCGGTVGFLQAVLRAVNVPVQLVQRCGHQLGYFPTLGAYLSHGDDLYNAHTRQSRCPAAEVLIDAPTFRAWFDDESRPDRCANVGRGAVEMAAKACAK